MAWTEFHASYVLTVRTYSVARKKCDSHFDDDDDDDDDHDNDDDDDNDDDIDDAKKISAARKFSKN